MGDNASTKAEHDKNREVIEAYLQKCVAQLAIPMSYKEMRYELGLNRRTIKKHIDEIKQGRTRR